MKKQKTPLPGTVLKETYLDAYQLTIAQFSEDVGLSASAIRQIINNKTKITLNVAARLAKYFNTTIQYWVDLQNAYDLVEIQRDEELMAAIKEISKAKKPSPAKKAAAAAAAIGTAKRGAKKASVSEAPTRGRRTKKEADDGAPAVTRKPRAKRVPKPAVEETTRVIESITLESPADVQDFEGAGSPGEGYPESGN
ncbi:MAG: HigA family addiction module antidote protein [Treponema sp.]|jgi:addiction module HigA family antidote|nr:HigA family addiction module antidote protein [Treponema sp.]